MGCKRCSSSVSCVGWVYVCALSLRCCVFFSLRVLALVSPSFQVSIIYRGQFQITLERAKITIFKADLRNHHDRVNHFPAFPSMICDFRSHNFFLGKVQCQFIEKTCTLLLHLFWAQNKTPQVYFRNARQYCTNLCFNHCFVHLIRFILGPCGPYSTQI